MKKKIIYLGFLLATFVSLIFLLPRNSVVATDTDFEIWMEATTYDSTTKENSPIESDSVNVGDTIDLYFYIKNVNSSENLIISSAEIEVTFDYNSFAYKSSKTTISGWNTVIPSADRIDPGILPYVVFNNKQTASVYTEIAPGETLEIGYSRFTVLTNITDSATFEITSEKNDCIADFYGDRIFEESVLTEKIELSVEYPTEDACFYSITTPDEFYYTQTNNKINVDVYLNNNTDSDISYKKLKTTFKIASDDVSNPLKYLTISSYTLESVVEDGTFSPNISDKISSVSFQWGSDDNELPFAVSANSNIKLFTMILDVTNLYEGTATIGINGGADDKTISADNINYTSEEFLVDIDIYNEALQEKSSDASLKVFSYGSISAIEYVNIPGWTNTDATGTVYELPDLSEATHSQIKLFATPNDSAATVSIETVSGSSCIYNQEGGYWVVDLEKGDNTINIMVTAEDTTELIYIVDVYLQSSEIGDYGLYLDDKLTEMKDDLFNPSNKTAKLSTSKSTFKFDLRSTEKISYEVMLNSAILSSDDLLAIPITGDSLTLEVTIYSEDKSNVQNFMLDITFYSSDTSLITLGYTINGAEKILFNDSHNDNLVPVGNGQSKVLYTFSITATTSGEINFVYDRTGYKALALENNLVSVTDFGYNNATINYDNGNISVTSSDIDMTKPYSYYISSTSISGNTAQMAVSIYNLSGDTAYFSKFTNTINADSGITLADYSTSSSAYSSTNYTFGSMNGKSGQLIRYQATVISTGYTPSEGIRTFNPIVTSITETKLFAETTFVGATLKVYNNTGLANTETGFGNEVSLGSDGYYTVSVVEGLNVYKFEILAGDNETLGYYYVNMHCRYSTVTIDKIVINDVDYTQTTSSEDGYLGVYDVEVENEVSTIKITPYGAQNANATIRNSSSITTTINELETLSFDITVISENNINTGLYKLNVTRKGNDISSAQSITITPDTGTVTWNKTFDLEVEEYEIRLTKDVNNIDFIINATNSNALIEFNAESATGTLTVSDIAINSVNGTTNYYTFEVTITSSSQQNTTTYTFYVHKEENTSLTKATFNGGHLIPLDNTLEYNVTVESNVDKIVLNPVSDNENVTIQVLDKNNENASTGLDIEIGTPIEMYVVVTSNISSEKFAATTSKYKFTFTRKGESVATLDFLGIDSGDTNILEEGITSYHYELQNGVTAATLYFERTSELSKSYLCKGTSVIDVTEMNSININNLLDGDNVYILKVVAQDNVTIIEYEINLYIKGNTNLDIALLQANNGAYVATLLGDGSYRFNVLDSEITLAVTAVLYNPQAMYEVDDIVVSTKTGSIKVYVGSVSKTYTIKVSTYSSFEDNHLRSMNVVNTDDTSEMYTTTIAMSHYAMSAEPRYIVYTTVPYTVKNVSYLLANATLDSGWTFTEVTKNLGTQTSLSKMMDTSFRITNGVESQYYILVVIREAASDDYSVTSLNMKGSDNNQYETTFNNVTNLFSVTVPYNVTSVTLGDIVICEKSKIDDITGSLQLANPGNVYTYTFKVTAESGNSNIYQISVTRDYSDDTSLATLKVNSYFIDDVEYQNTENKIGLSYVQGQETYTLSVEYAITKLTLFAALPIASTATLNPVDGLITKELTEGNGNYFEFIVTANANKSTTYRVQVTRLPRSSSKELKELTVTDSTLQTSTPSYDVSAVAYTKTVEFKHEYVFINVTSHTGVSYYVKDSVLTEHGYKVLLTKPIDKFNSVTKAEIVIVAEDETQYSYYINIYRKPDSVATIESFELSTNAVSFTNDTTNEVITPVGLVYGINKNNMHYTVVVPNNILTFDISATPTSSEASIEVIKPTGNLSTSNYYTYSVKCIAQDGTTFTYYIDAIREKSNDTTIGDKLYITRNTGGTRTAITKASDGTWSIDLDYSITALTKIEIDEIVSTYTKLVLRVGENSYQAITGAKYFEGNFELVAPVDSNKALTEFLIDVYAEDETTYSTYTLNVYRKPDNNIDVGGFKLTEGHEVELLSNKNTYYYSVENWDRTKEFYAEVYLPENTTASVTSGLSKKLEIGKSIEFAFTVTAQDGVTNRKISLFVIIYAESDAHLDNIYISDDKQTEVKYVLGSTPVYHQVERFNDYAKLSVKSEDYSQYVNSITWTTKLLKNQPLTSKIYIDEPVRNSLGQSNVIYTEVTVTVTAEDTVTKHEYTIYLYRKLDTENKLESLVFAEPQYVANGVYYNTFIDDEGNPVTFSPNVLDYKVNIFTSYTSATISAKVKNGSTAIISENLKTSYETTIDIIDNETVFTVSVLSEHGQLKTYSITIVKKTNTESDLLSITTTTDNKSYSPNSNHLITLVSPYEIEYIGFTYKVSQEAKLIAYSDSALTKEIDLLSIKLEKPDFSTTSFTTFYIYVESEDGSTNNVYEVTVERLQDTDKTVSSLIFTPAYISLNEKFETNVSLDNHTYEYTITVINDISNISIELGTTNDNVRISTSSTGFNNISVIEKDLDVSVNEFVFYVTSMAGSKDTYIFYVTRLDDLPIVLEGFDISNNQQLNQPFTRGNQNYTIDVPNEISTLTITALTQNGYAVSVVEGKTQTKTLSTTSTTVFTFTVQYSTATLTYNILVTRAKSTIATLSTINLTSNLGDNRVLNVINNELFVVYLPYGSTQVELTPILDSDMATCDLVTTHTLTNPTSINPSKKVITFSITAENTEFTNEYTIEIYVLPDTDSKVLGFNVEYYNQNGSLIGTDMFDAKNSIIETVSNEIYKAKITPTLSNSATQSINYASLEYNLEPGVAVEYLFVVTAQNGSNAYYRILIKREYNTSKDVLSFQYKYTLNGNEIVIPLEYSVLDGYPLTVPFEVDEVSIEYTISSTATSSTPKKYTLGMPTTEGNYVYNGDIVVVAQDKSEARYMFTITRLQDDDNSIDRIITYIPGYENPTVNPNDSHIYSLTVDYSVKEISAAVILKTDSTAVILNSIDNEAVGVGENIYSFGVKAQNGNTTEYNLVVNRERNKEGKVTKLFFVTSDIRYELTNNNGTWSITLPYEIKTGTLSITSNNISYISEGAVLKENFEELTLVSPSQAGVGVTKQSFVVVSQDGVEHEYNVEINRLQDNKAIIDNIDFNAYLKDGVTPLNYVMTPLAFKPNVLNYSIELLHDSQGGIVEFDASLNSDNTASFKANSLANISDVITFEDGTKTYLFEVVSQDGSITTTYTFNVKMASNSAKELFGVALPDGTEFVKNAQTGEYELEVPYEVDTVSLDVSYSPGATLLTTNLTDLKLNAPTMNTNSSTTFVIEIMAQDGSKASYKAVVTRKQNTNTYLSNLVVAGYEIDPLFDKTIQSYTLTVDQSVFSLEVTAILSDEATQSLEIVSYPTTLVTGSGNIFRFIVTAQNGEKRIYILTVYKEQSSEIAVNRVYGIVGAVEVPLEKTALGAYVATVPYSVSTMSFGLDVAKGCTYEAEAIYELMEPTAVSDSNTTIKIVVTAEDGVTKQEITIHITRQRDTVNGLQNLYISYDKDKLSIDQRFNESLKPDIESSYTALIPYSKAEVYIVAQAKSGTQSIYYRNLETNETITAEYIAVSLAYGEVKQIEVYVASQNGVILKNTITVSRNEPDANCELLNVSIYGSQTKKNYTKDLVHKTGKGFKSNIYEYDLVVTGNDSAIIVNGTTSKLASSVTGFATYKDFPCTITITVTAENLINTKTYKINVTKLNDDTSLKDLKVSGTDLEFDKDKYVYDLVIYQGEQSSVNVQALKNNDKQIIYINSNLVENGSATIDLTPGENQIIIDVEAENQDTSQYIINVEYVTASGNTYLKDLVIKDYQIEFNKFTSLYEITTKGDDKSIFVTATPESSYSTVKGVGDLELRAGINIFDIIVTAQNGNTRTYTIKVNWNDSYNDYLKTLTVEGFEDQIEFNPVNQSYFIKVVGDYSSINIIAQAQSPLAKVTGDGEVSLLGASTTYIISVHANKEFVRNYQIEVEYIPESKDAYLTHLEVEGYEISPTFDRETFEYYLEIIDDISKVNINATTSSTLSTIVTGLGINNLVDGDNIIPVTVKAFEGNELSYNVNIHLITSVSNNFLKDLQMEEAEIEFDFLTNEYVVAVPQDTLFVNINAQAQSPLSKITGDGKIEIETGENALDIVVTSSLGVDNVYTIYVYRPESNNALLDWLAIEGVQLDFHPETNEYDVVVPEEITNVNIDATTQSTLAKLEGIGNKTLEYGENTQILKVTAEDGTVNEYVLNIYRTLCSNNYLASLYVWVNERLVELIFDKETQEYEITISGNEIVIQTECEHETAKYEINIPEKISSKTDLTISVTAQNGDVRVYTIHVTRTDFAWLMYIAIGIGVLIVACHGVYYTFKKKYFTE